MSAAPPSNQWGGRLSDRDVCKMRQRYSHQRLLHFSTTPLDASFRCSLQCTTTSFNLHNESKLGQERPNSRRTSTSSSRKAATITSHNSSVTDHLSLRSELSTATPTFINNTKPTHSTTNIPVPALTSKPDEDIDEVGVQELTVYEVNELDRGSPVLLSLSKLAVDWYKRFRVPLLGGLGDLVPFSNKLFDGSLKKRLGITAGMISVIRHYPNDDALLFEAVYSFYFGDYGHISVKGPYKSNHEDKVLTVTGGSGIFAGVYGTVQIHNVEYPLLLFYKFQLHGIPQLPQALKWDTIPPTKGLRPSCTASMPGFALPNFTD